MLDFYDVYILALEYRDKINMGFLAAALVETAKYRGTYRAVVNVKKIIIKVFNSDRVKVCLKLRGFSPRRVKK